MDRRALRGFSSPTTIRSLSQACGNCWNRARFQRRWRGARGTGSDRARAIASARRAVADLAMPRVSGLDVLRQLTSEVARPRVVLLTASIDRDDIVVALRLGAAGVLLKTAATELLFKCLRTVMSGGYWVDRDTVGSLVDALAKVQAPTPNPHCARMAHATGIGSGRADRYRGLEQRYCGAAQPQRRDGQAPRHEDLREDGTIVTCRAGPVRGPLRLDAIQSDVKLP